MNDGAQWSDLTILFFKNGLIIPNCLFTLSAPMFCWLIFAIKVQTYFRMMLESTFDNSFEKVFLINHFLKWDPI